MKYYAVTDDIHELYHYGVKGMKWGQHLFGDDKQRSPGYKKAIGKLRDIAKSIRNDVEVRSNNRYQRKMDRAIQRSALSKKKYSKDLQNRIDPIKLKEIKSQLSQEHPSHWLSKKPKDPMAKEMKRQQRVAKEQERYQREINKAMARSQLSKMKYSVDKELSDTNVFDRAYATSKVGDSIRKAKKFTQQAREGRLRYGKLSDNQIGRMTERLSLEQQARRLGGTEKSTYRQRRKDAIREGKLEGYRRGTAAAMEEVGRGLATYGISNWRNRKIINANNARKAALDKEYNRIRNHKTSAEIKKDIDQEIKELNLRYTKKRGNNLQEAKAKEIEALRKLDIQDKLARERDEAYARILNINGKTDAEARAEQEEFLKVNNDGITRFIPGRKSLSTKESKKFSKLSKEQQQEYIINKERNKAIEEIEAHERTESEYKEKMNQYKKEEAQYRKDKEKYDNDLDEYPRLLAKQEKSWNDHVAAVDAENKRLQDKYNDDLKAYNDAWDNYHNEDREYKKRVAANRLQGFGSYAGPVPKKPTMLKPQPPALKGYGKKPDSIKPPIEPTPPKEPTSPFRISSKSRSIYDQLVKPKNNQGQGKGKGKGKNQ